VERPPGVVLVGDGRTEQRHDPVTRELVDGAFPPVHGVQHALKGAVHDRVELLGIQRRRELGGPLDVHEEHRHLLPLTSEGPALLQDARGQMLGGVGGGRARGLGSPGRVRRHRGTALVAEAGAGPQALSAGGTAGFDRRPAGLAEPRGLPVCVAALGAGHGRLVVAESRVQGAGHRGLEVPEGGDPDDL
jgi:hypothetical protein